MTPALVELVLRSARGRFVRSIRLLARPRYALGMLAGAVYFAWWIANTLRMHGHAPWLPAGGAGEAWTLGALFLAAAGTLTWIFSRGRAALRLAEAEVHVLLTAPVSRRQVLQYALLKAQPGILAGSAVMTLVLARGERLERWPGFWALLTLVDLHAKGCALWKTRQGERSRAAARRWRLAVGTVLVVFWVATVPAMIEAWHGVQRVLPAGRTGDPLDPLQVLRAASAGLETESLRVVLAPFLWATGGAFAPTGPERAASLVLAGLLLVLHHEWVVRSKARFEEATLEGARRLSAIRQHPGTAMLERLSPSTRRAQAFPLPPTGAPGMAIYWKNIRLVFRRPLVRTVALGLAVLAAVTVALGVSGAPPFAVAFGIAMGTTFTAFLALVGGAVFRNDFRAELSRLELLRTWPVPAWQFVAAEVLASATAGFLALLFSIGLVLATDSGVRLAALLGRGSAERWALGPGTGEIWGVPGALFPWLVAAGVLALGAALALLSSALQNVITLLFPGWVPAAAAPSRFEPGAFGQRLLYFTAMIVMVALALLPSALMVGAVLLIQRFAGMDVTAFEFPLLGALAALVPLFESVLLVALGARLWRRLDPAEILEAGD